jgi:hypothetical protein
MNGKITKLLYMITLGICTGAMPLKAKENFGEYNFGYKH